MSTTVKAGWLKDSQGNKFAPKTLSSQVTTNDGILLEDKIYADLGTLETSVKGYTDTKVADLVGAAPELLDTFEEVATAIKENQDVADALQSAIGNKVDKEEGKGLSSNDFTDEEKEKLASLSENGSLTDEEKALLASIENKVDIAQGAENAGKILSVDEEGNVSLNTAPEMMAIAYDEEEQILEFTSKSQLPGNVGVDSSLSTSGDAADAKVVGDRLKTLEEMLENGVGIASWNDLQDKPFYEDGVKENIILDEISYEFTEEDNYYYGESILDIKEGKEYTITYDDTQYTCKAWYYEDWESMMLGNDAAIGEDELGDDVPFLVEYYGDGYGEWYLYAEIGQHTIKITEIVPNIKTIEEKFLPESVFTQADWNQTDKTKPDFIKNKPFYSEDASYEFFWGSFYIEYDPDTSSNYYYGTETYNFPIGLDFMYNIRFEDNDYIMHAHMVNKDYYRFGAPYNEDTNEYDFSEHSFAIEVKRTGTGYYPWVYTLAVPNTKEQSEYEVYISVLWTEHKKLQDEYLVNPDWNETDVRKASTIQNKPFGDNMPIGEYESIVFDEEVELDGNWYADITMNEDIKKGSMYDVVMDGHMYNYLVCYDYSIGFDMHGSGDNAEVPFTIEGGSYPRFYYNPYLVFSTNWNLEIPESVHLTIYKHKTETKKLDDKYLPQSDWNELDETKGTFVANRPFGKYRTKVLSNVIPETEIVNGRATVTQSVQNYTGFPIHEGCTYTVILNGKEYSGLTCYVDEDDYYLVLGTSGGWGANFSGSEYPFSIIMSKGYRREVLVYTMDQSGTIEVYREGYITETKKLDDKYLPQSDWNELDANKGTFIANKPFGEYRESANIKLADGVYSSANMGIRFPIEDKYYLAVKSVDFEPSFDLSEDKLYTIVINGVTYSDLSCKTNVFSQEWDGEIIQYTEHIIGCYYTDYDISDTPFTLRTIRCEYKENGQSITEIYSSLYIGENSQITSLNVQVYEQAHETKVKKIDPKYIPETLIDERINAIFKLDGTTLTITTI